MDEELYRKTYESLNPKPCAFEKSIHSRRTACSQSHRFCLADREGVSCQSDAHFIVCNRFLENLRPKALFALHLTKITGVLPHAKEIKIQTGGLLGVQTLLSETDAGSEPIPTDIDICRMLEQLQSRFPDFETLPYEPIIRAVVHFEDRKKKRN